MQRRVSRDDVRQAAELTKDLEQGGVMVWPVADEYELRGDEIVAKPKKDDLGYPLWWGYEPLEDAPELFLTFARLYDEPDFEVAVLEWCRQYGLLGELDGGLGKMPRRTPIAVFREEVAQARLILLVYEAVLNRDANAVSELFKLPKEAGKASTALLWEAMNSIRFRVQRMVQNHCLPMLTIPDRSSLEVKSTWHFSTLLGAMYLQMFWLMSLNGNITRCEYCGRVMSLTRPHPEGRKRRGDKRFCNAACRQAHHRSKSKS